MHPDSKVRVANMGSTWVLAAPGGPHVDPMNLAIRMLLRNYIPTYKTLLNDKYLNAPIASINWHSLYTVHLMKYAQRVLWFTV